MAPSAKADKKKKDKSGGNKENDQRPIICCVPEGILKILSYENL